MGAIIANDGGGGGASYRAHRSGIGRKAEGPEKDAELRPEIKNPLDLLGKKLRESVFSEGGAPCWCNFFTTGPGFHGCSSASFFFFFLRQRTLLTLQAAKKKKNDSGWSFSRRLCNQFSRETSGKIQTWFGARSHGHQPICRCRLETKA